MPLPSVTPRAAGAVMVAALAAAIASCGGEPTSPPRPNQAPVAAITLPAAGATFRAGDEIAYAGAGSDAEDGALPVGRLTWWVEQHRGAQVQVIVPRTSGRKSGTLAVPTRDGVTPDMWYRIHLEVRDAAGAADTVTRDVVPQTATMRFETAPTGLQVLLDGVAVTAPHERLGVAGVPIDLSVATPQALGAAQWAFASWSDGGERVRTLATPSANATYTATFALVPPPNQAPTVQLTAPGAGATLARGAPVTLRATAADADGAVVSVVFLDGATVVGTDAAAPFEMSWTPDATGARTLTARATDDDGATATSTAVVVTVVEPANQVPTVALTAPTAGASIVQGTPVPLAATAADADGSIAQVEFLVGGTTVGSDAATPYAATWTPPSAGTFTLTARATDDRGATATSAAVSVTVQPPPNQLPTVALTAPAAGATLVRGVAATLAATAADADGDVARVEFLVAGVSVGVDQAPPFAVSWTPTNTGPVAITARATDDDGGASTSAAVTVTIVDPPNQPPTVALLAPVDGSTVTIGSVVALRAAPADADGAVARVDYYDGATLVASATAAPWEATWTAATLGAHPITARAVDDDGATTTSGTATVTVVPVPNVAPTVTLTAPVAGATVTRGTTVQLAASAQDADGSVTQVEFFAGATSLGEDASAPYGTAWTPTALGTVLLVARATDDDGAVASSVQVSVTVVEPPNVAPAVALVAPAADTVITLGTTVTLRAQATDADGQVVAVAFLDGAALVGSATQAPHVVAWTPTSPGTHLLAARATDDDGATTMSATVSVSVVPPPNQPPTVALTAPAAGATLVRGTAVALAASAADADGSVARVEFLVGGVVVATDAAAPFAATWTPASVGPASLAVRATDDDGATTTSAAVAVTVVEPPNQPPAVTLTAPADGGTLSVNVPVTLRASAADADGVVARVDFLDGATVLGSDTSAPFELAWTPTTLGVRTITARAVDDDGATGTSTATVTVVPQPNVAPLVTLTAPAAGASIVVGSAVAIAATASDVDGSVARVEFFAGATSVGSDATAPFGATWTPMATGTFQLTARATDDAGAVTTSAVVQVTVVEPPNQPPAVALTAPSAGASFTVNTPVTVRATAADGDGTIAQVQFVADGVPVGTVTASPYEITWLPTTTGTVTLVARATDDDGATTASAGVAVTIVPRPNVAPTVALTAPAAGSAITLGSSVSLAATAADADGAVAQVQFLAGATVVGTDASAPYQIAWTPTAPGTYALAARAVDDSGATATSASITFTVLPPPNVAPTVALLSPPADSTIVVGTSVTVRATAADGDGTVTQVAFYDGATQVGIDAQPPYGIAWTPATTGPHVLTARATDDDGATTTSASVTVLVVPVPNQPPTVTLIAPAAGSSFLLGATVTVRATAADADGTVARVDFLDGATLIASDASAPFEIAWSPASAGTRTLTARAVDDDGAVTVSAGVSVTITSPPNQLPTVALTAPAAGATLTLGAPVTLRATAADADGRVVSVAFLEGSTVVGTTTASPHEIVWTPSSLGSRSLAARAVDDSGGVAVSAPVSVTVVPPPNVAPTVTVTAPGAGSSIVLGTSVTVSASAADVDGSVVRVDFYDGATLVGSDEAAPFEIAWVPSALGARTLTARATDDDGAVTTSAAVGVTVVAPPNVAPTVAITAPASGTTIVLGGTLTIAATATDDDGTVTQVTFLAGSATIGVDAGAPYSVLWTPTAAGTYTVTARATDDDGAETTSASVTVTVSPRPNVPPTVSLTAPAAGATPTIGTPLTLRATASDADGRVVGVAFLDGATVVGTATASPFEVAWTPSALGERTLTARATDDSGAVVTSAPVVVTVVPAPNVPPTVALSSPASGATITLGGSFALAATVADADGSVTQVEFLAGTTSVGVVASAPYALAWTPAAAGTYALTARATDDDGATTTSASVTVTVLPVPNVAPAVTITAPAAGATLTAGVPVTLRATATDSDGLVTQVLFVAAGAAVGTATAAPFEVAWTPTAAGSVTLEARATDDSGAVTTSAPVGVTVVAPPNQPPTATITAPVANAPFRAGDTITYAGAGTDPEDGAVPPARMTWWVDLHHDTHTHPLVGATTGAAGGTVVLPTAIETSDNIWYRFSLAVTDAAGAADTVHHDVLPVKSTMRFETVPAGLQITLEGQPRATPLDVVGVVGTRRQLGVPASQTLNGTEYVFAAWSDGGAAAHDIATPATATTYVATFTAVAPANQPPTVSVTAPVAGSTLTAGTPVTLRATAADADGSVVQVAFFVDGAPVGTTATSPYEVAWTPSTLGGHQITARATDDDGDFTVSAAIAVTVEAAGGGDVTAPTVQLLSPANDARNLTGSLLVRASATDDVGVAGVTFQVDGETVGGEDTTAPYELTIPSTTAWTSGQHVIRVRARDLANNLSPWVSVTVGFGGTVNLPPGFSRTAFVGGLSAATTMAWAPDGRLFVAEQGGALRVVKNGVLLATPFHQFPTVPTGERGLLGVTFDPDFASNGWVYAYYTAQSPARNVVVRIRAVGDVADPASVQTLLQLPALEEQFHNGGALHFGPDRRLYVAVGDNYQPYNAPLLTSLLGKILRIEADGSIPADNPFFTQATGNFRAIWARGLRNPFTFGFQPGTGRMHINDVGQDAWEEINEGVAGSNYGWPATEGYTSNPAYRSPLFAYPHSGGIVQGFSIVGAAFYNPSTITFPASHVGDYFFGDYVSGWVNRMDLDNGNAVYAFARIPNNALVDVRTGPDGALYVLADNVGGSWGVWRIQRTP